MVIAITKFDTNYSNCDASSGSDDESDSSLPRYRRIEETTKHKLCECIEDATTLAISPDVILPLCGKWALQSSKLRSCLESCEEQRSKNYLRRLKEAATTLQKHPAHSDLNIPGAQGQSELDAICALGPSKLVESLDQVTGIQALRKR